MNVVALIGHLTRPAEERVLPSGDRLIELQVTTARENARAETVPVVWFDPPASAANLDVDETVVVVGRVRRRFFRTGGTTQSRTEVVATSVVPARLARRARRIMAHAFAAADEAAEVELTVPAQ